MTPRKTPSDRTDRSLRRARAWADSTYLRGRPRALSVRSAISVKGVADRVAVRPPADVGLRAVLAKRRATVADSVMPQVRASLQTVDGRAMLARTIGEADVEKTLTTFDVRDALARAMVDFDAQKALRRMLDGMDARTRIRLDADAVAAEALMGVDVQGIVRQAFTASPTTSATQALLRSYQEQARIERPAPTPLSRFLRLDQAPATRPAPAVRPRRRRVVRPAPAFDPAVALIAANGEAWLARRCPLALRRLRGARAALLRGDIESLAQCLASCRRTIEALADALFAPGQGTASDSGGRALEIAANNYRNRLVLHLDRTRVSRTHHRSLIASLEVLLIRLTDEFGKGVHGDVCRAEAEQAYLLTLFVVCQVAR